MSHEPRGRHGAEETYTVLYDGDCPLCRASVARLRGWDRRGVLTFLPFQDPGVPSLFPWIPREDLEEAVHLVGPRKETWAGADAIERAMSLLPGWRRLLARLLRMPWVRPLALRVYRWVARRRRRVQCGEHCP